MRRQSGMRISLISSLFSWCFFTTAPAPQNNVRKVTYNYPIRKQNWLFVSELCCLFYQFTPCILKWPKSRWVAHKALRWSFLCTCSALCFAPFEWLLLYSIFTDMLFNLYSLHGHSFKTWHGQVLDIFEKCRVSSVVNH